MNFILFDDERYYNLLPLTHTRPVASLRCGILTMLEKWNLIFKLPVSTITQAYLQEKFPLITTQDNICINAGLFPSPELVEQILLLKKGESLYQNKTLLACRIDQARTKEFNLLHIESTTTKKQFHHELKQLLNLWDIFSLNDWALRQDYNAITKNRVSASLTETNICIGKDIFIEEGATINCATFNTTTGPIYIGKGAEIMEGSLIRGPFAMGEKSVLKLGTKIYGATTIGEGCKVGGEVNNSVFYANSNKAHDGFIGNAVIGEWCNIGADSNNSNLKNNYEEVKLWNEHKGTFIKTGLQFCGLILADHAKCGINTMFNTGTVVGVSCNVYGAGFPRNFIPSFSWGSANGFMEYQLHKAIETATKVFERRNITFNDTEKKIFETVFERTSSQRIYK